MSNSDYKEWYVQGLQALESASKQGRDDTSSTEGITSPELKQLFEGSSKIMAQHATTISQLIEKAGGTAGDTPNKIIEGIRAGSAQMVQAAKDPAVRDASVIAAAQITCHYYVAAYGTLASTAKHLGMNDDAETFKRMSDEMKTGDARLTEVAENMANKRAGNAA